MMSRIPAAILGGAAGAATLTLLHQFLKRVTPDAPRLDNLGKQGLRKVIAAAGADIPDDETLHWSALAGDFVANTAYYGAALALGYKPAQWLAPILGAGAGVGSVLLPAPMGLDSDETNRTPLTKALAIGLYLAGGLAAAATYRALSEDRGQSK